MNKQAESFQIETPASAQVGRDRAHESAHLHVAGAATYIDDMPELDGTLHAALGLSPMAHGRLLAIDVAGLRALPGVVAVFTAADFVLNDCAPIVKGDDPILAHAEVHYLGQPMFAVVAADRRVARRVAARAKDFVTLEALPALLNAREGHAAQAYVVPPMRLARGDAQAAIAAAPQRFKDSLSVGGQEQFYLEGQISYAMPHEDGQLLVHCSTQHPTRDAAHGRPCTWPRRQPGAGAVPPHGRWFWRQRVAVRTARVRGGVGGKPPGAAGETAAGS